MTSMVERVARALHKANYDASPDRHFPEYDGFRAPWDILARAAIEAMREPTVVMLAGAYDHITAIPESEPLRPGPLYAAMIDTALNEQSEGR